MMTHWTIKILNALFVCSLAATVIWLLGCALVHDWAARMKPVRKGALLLNILKEGLPYLRKPLLKKRYTIGREADCDIPLKGVGLPLRAEIRVLEDCCLFHLNDGRHSSGNNGKIGERLTVKPGQELALCSYVLRIEHL